MHHIPWAHTTVLYYFFDFEVQIPFESLVLKFTEKPCSFRYSRTIISKVYFRTSKNSWTTFRKHRGSNNVLFYLQTLLGEKKKPVKIEFKVTMQ